MRTVTQRSIREAIGIVPQETLLFGGTIRENIRYGRLEASDAEIEAAARAANAHDFIVGLPDGYDTIVGERGIRLSGGQRQRIAIARAILKDPRILILDEATSSVDTETEALIREAIDRLVKNRTTIAIAHRLSTLRNADRLIVLENGRIVEIGTHEELLAKPDGVFRRLVDIQAELSRVVAVGG
jgi:ATP-binding cassette subfamily B protein